MPAPATSVQAYLAALPKDRRAALEAVRAEINRRLPKGYEEGIQYGMIGWFVPHSRFPAGYHCDPRQPLPFAGLASQKHHMSLYLMCIYGNPDQHAWFEKAWERTGKRLDMGQACVRFRKIEDVPLEVVGEAVARVPVDTYLAHYEAMLALTGAGRKHAAKADAAKAPAKEMTAARARGKGAKATSSTAAKKDAKATSPPKVQRPARAKSSGKAKATPKSKATTKSKAPTTSKAPPKAKAPAKRKGASKPARSRKAPARSRRA